MCSELETQPPRLAAPQGGSLRLGHRGLATVLSLGLQIFLVQVGGESARKCPVGSEGHLWRWEQGCPGGQWKNPPEHWFGKTVVLLTSQTFSVGRKASLLLKGDFTFVGVLPGVWDFLEWGCGALLSGTLLYAQRLTRPSHTPRDQKLSILSIVKKTTFFSGGMGRVHTSFRIKGFIGCYCG